VATEAHHITIGGLQIEIVRKAIKNLHLGVYPPHGRVRVAAPNVVSDDAVRLAVISRLAWIKRQQKRFRAQERQSPRRYVSGESHYLWGRRYRFNVIEDSKGSRVVRKGHKTLDYYVREGCDETEREKHFLAWYRRELRTAAGPLIEKWTRIMKLPRPDWRIKRMKTKWGSCSIKGKRIWLNLELVKKHPPCLEYVIVHEMAHFEERHHNDRFVKLMDRHLPQWRLYRDELNAAPLRHEQW
jgi:predicted metal-dependent hydrolase